MNEAEIEQAHKDRWAVVLEQYGGDKFAVPQSEISRLIELNKQDWIAFVEARDGRRMSREARKQERVRSDVEEAERALAAFQNHRIDPNDPRVGKA